MVVKKGFIAEGTTCDSCATIIKKQALKVDGVNEVSFDLSTETGYVTFDEKKQIFIKYYQKLRKEITIVLFLMKKNKRPIRLLDGFLRVWA